jgi:phosphoribosylaminoimidazolecarboxamide formyltransferase/IMP cyclohydrolase
MNGASGDRGLGAGAGVERNAIPIRRALISVSDKTGLLELATALASAGVEMVSTGSTARTIGGAGLAVTEVSEVTGFPEFLDGRVKTLHPSVHAGILADLRLDSHATQLADVGVRPFELVVVNLYPFVETVASGAVGDDVVEQIDIGGPAMVRAAAKNHANVAIVVSPSDYGQVVKSLTLGGTTLAQRKRLAAAAFAHTAAYDTAVAEWFAAEAPAAEEIAGADADAATGFAPELRLTLSLGGTLRYGENSHQAAALYRERDGRGIAQAEQLHGKEMSYNNYVDADAALRAAHDFNTPAVAIIKHANPCGIATDDNIAEAYRRAHECDPVSAFGGVIASNRTVTATMAERIADVFTEVVVAPDFEPIALDILRAKKNIRLLRLPENGRRSQLEFRQVSGGALAQTLDRQFAPASAWTLVSGAPADAAALADLEFAWRACRSVKSNAILLASNRASIGVGMGQVNRVDSCHLAVSRAGERAAGSVAASDAFFPFADGLEVLLQAGIRAVVQPGGSVRDAEVIAAAEAAGATMYFTGERHFFH